jgi:hypothetical protein
MTNAPSAEAPGRTASSAMAPACGTTQFTCAGRPVFRAFGHLANTRGSSRRSLARPSLRSAPTTAKLSARARQIVRPRAPNCPPARRLWQATVTEPARTRDESPNPSPGGQPRRDGSPNPSARAFRDARWIPGFIPDFPDGSPNPSRERAAGVRWIPEPIAGAGSRSAMDARIHPPGGGRTADGAGRTADGAVGRRGQLAAAPSRSPVRPRVMPGSTGTPGPIVVENVIFLR